MKQSEKYRDFITPSVNSKAFLDDVSETETRCIILNLKNTNSCGYDNQNSKVFKLVCKYHCNFIQSLLNQWIREGKFFEALKYSTILPILKTGNPDVFTNHLPISLLPVFSKIVEEVVSIIVKKF